MNKPAQILPPSEDLNFADLQLAVFDRAGDLMSEVSVTSGGEEAQFEDMSMVFHPTF